MQYAYMAQQKSPAMHFLLVEIHIYQKHDVINAIVSLLPFNYLRGMVEIPDQRQHLCLHQPGNTQRHPLIVRRMKGLFLEKLSCCISGVLKHKTMVSNKMARFKFLP